MPKTSKTGKLHKHRFTYLLVLLVAMFAGMPVVRELEPYLNSTVSRIEVSVLFIAMLTSAVMAIGRTKRTTMIVLCIAFPVVIFQIVQTLVRHSVVDLLAQLQACVFLGYVVVVITKFLFSGRRVDTDTICASVCVYLLLGVFWALLLSSLEIVSPGSFAGPRGVEEAVIEFGGESTSDAVYFSFVTLTTLGFGDIAPVSPSAKMLVSMEAIVGQLYLSVLVARLVGIYSGRSSADDEESTDP